MRRNIIKGVVFLSFVLFCLPALAEINFSPSTDKVEVINSGEIVATLNATNLESTVKDTTGGVFEVKFNPEEKKVDINAVSGLSTMTFGIATIYLKEDSSLSINYAQANIVKMKNISEEGDLSMVFPDKSRADLHANAEISLQMAADEMWYLKVLAESVEFYDIKGYQTTMTINSPAVTIEGFKKTPWWRKINWARPFPDASSMYHQDEAEHAVTP